MFEIEELWIDIGGFDYRNKNKKRKVLRALFVLDLCDVAGEDKKREEFTKFRTTYFKWNGGLLNLLKVWCSMVGSIVIAWVTFSTVTSWAQKTFFVTLETRVFQCFTIIDQLKWQVSDVQQGGSRSFTSATVQESSCWWRSETNYCLSSHYY